MGNAASCDLHKHIAHTLTCRPMHILSTVESLAYIAAASSLSHGLRDMNIQAQSLRDCYFHAEPLPPDGLVVFHLFHPNVVIPKKAWPNQKPMFHYVAHALCNIYCVVTFREPISWYVKSFRFNYILIYANILLPLTF